MLKAEEFSTSLSSIVLPYPLCWIQYNLINLSNSKGTVTYNGTTYTQCLKIESSTTITFTTTQKMQLTLVLGNSDKYSIKVDGEKVTGQSNVITVTLDAGTHTLTKADVTNLYYIALDAVE